MRLTLIALLLAGWAPSANAAPPAKACPIDRTLYRLDRMPQVTAGFVREELPLHMTSNLLLWVKTPKRLWWFSFSSPNGYGGTYLQPDLDPWTAAAKARAESESDAPPPEPQHKSDEPREPDPVVTFDAFDDDLLNFESAPQADDKAPKLFFSRGLGPALWYNPVWLSNGDPKASDESIPTAFFRAAGCRAKGATPPGAPVPISAPSAAGKEKP